MRYTDEQKATVLRQLRTQAVHAVSAQTGIPVWTVRRWQQDHQANRAAELEVRLLNLQEQLAENAQNLALAIDASIDGAPLNQLSSALNAVIDRYLKLDEHLQTRNQGQEERVIRIEYSDAEGNVYNTPHWATPDSAAETPVQGNGLWAALWQDGDGQSPVDADGAAGRDVLVDRADIRHGQPGMARPEDDACSA